MTTRTKEVASLFHHLPGYFVVPTTDPDGVDRGIGAASTTAQPAAEMSDATQAACRPDRTLGHESHRTEALVTVRSKAQERATTLPQNA